MRKRFGTMFMALLLVCSMIAPSFSMAATTTSTQTAKIGPGGEVIMYHNGGKKRVYRNFDKTDYNGFYGVERGAGVTATATILSGLVNFFILPDVVHQGTNQYSETYAIKKKGSSYSKVDSVTKDKRISSLGSVTPTMLMLNEILKNSGLKTKFVKKITSSSAKEVSDHLNKGNPVLFVTNKNKKYQGITMTNEWTTMSILGVDEKGKALVMNSTAGRVNYSNIDSKAFSFTPTEIVKNFMVSVGDELKMYSGGNGGYILVYPKAATTKVSAMRLSRRNLKIDKDETYLLSAYVNPATTDQSVIWKSSNEDVVSVNEDGEVTGVSPGTAVVTGTSVQDGSFKDSCNITVYAGEVKSVTLTSPKKELSYGQKVKLNLSVDGGSGNEDIVWYSSNREKATVDENGTVTAVGNGFVDITAKVGARSAYVTILTKRYSPTKLEGDVDVTMYYNGKEPRKYRSYSQSAYNGSYGGRRGCAITAAAIVMSGLISNNITPSTVHSGSGIYSERYAIKKLGSRYKKFDSISGSARISKLNNSTPTNLMLQEILGNAGLKTKYVRSTSATTVAEVYAHLSKGNPVIFTTRKSKSYRGITLANTWHTLVMVGLDANGNAIVINPATGRVNYSHSKKKYFHFTPAEILQHFEPSCKSKTTFYGGDRYGFILVSK